MMAVDINYSTKRILTILLISIIGAAWLYLDDFMSRQHFVMGALIIAYLFITAFFRLVDNKASPAITISEGGFTYRPFFLLWPIKTHQMSAIDKILISDERKFGENYLIFELHFKMWVETKTYRVPAAESLPTVQTLSARNLPEHIAHKIRAEVVGH